MNLIGRFLTGSAYGVASSILKAGVNLVLIPLLLASIGATEYGLYALLMGFTELAFLMDLGFSTVLTRELSARAETHFRSQQTLQVGHFFYLGFAALVLGAGWFLVPTAVGLFQVPEALTSTAIISAHLVLGACRCCLVLLHAFAGARGRLSV